MSGKSRKPPPLWNPEKKKPKKKRLFQYQSGAAPYLVDEEGTLRVMLVTPGAGGCWILPKGHIAKGMGTPESAAKEAFEEAGVLGSCDSEILGISHFERPSGETVIVNIYPLKIRSILPEWEESAQRRRRLFRLDRAVALMPTEQAKEVLRTLQKKVQNGCKE